MNVGKALPIRLLAVAYAAVCYAVFVLVFLYAIGFVAGQLVPKHIDNGATGDFGTSLLVDVVLLGLFSVQHSGMARPGFKRWWTKFVPEPIERSTYVLVASFALALLFWQWRPLPQVVWHVDGEVGRWVLYALQALGWLLVLMMTFAISHLHLFGLTQVWRYFRHLPIHREQPFVIGGLYRLMRHPMMLGFLIAFWATPDMSVGHLLFAIMTSAYILFAVKLLEERDLAAEFGDRYRDYQSRVPMILPLPKRTR